MSDVMTFSKRTAAGLEEVLRTLLLDSENKVPAERLRIVGALASGHIIESGSNANGNYVRFADGTQWCWGSKTITLTSNVVNNIHKMTYDGVVFPAAFTDSPACSVSVDWETQSYAWTNCHRRHSGSFNLSVYSIYAFTEKNIGISYLAIGKWK